jgi:hypothetical protein
MTRILEIETITCDHNELHCVAYTQDQPDMVHYTNIDLTQLLMYIARTRIVHGVKVQVDEERSEHILNYLETNFEQLILEMITND